MLTNDDFGADGKGNGGGGLLSIKIDGVTYSFDGTKIVNGRNVEVIAGATLVEPTLLGGLLEFHFDSGNYTYTPPDVTAAKSENFTYTIVDGDGDQDTATLHIDITDSGVSVVDPSVIFGKDTTGATNDNLTGTARDDIMSGGAGNDTVSGGDGNDHIQGGAGNDLLLGGAGIDVLIGGAGTHDRRGGRLSAATATTASPSAPAIAPMAAPATTPSSSSTMPASRPSRAAAPTRAEPGRQQRRCPGLQRHARRHEVRQPARSSASRPISMADSVGGAGADKLTINASDVIDLGTGHLDPGGTFGAFGELTDAPAIRVDGDDWRQPHTRRHRLAAGDVELRAACPTATPSTSMIARPPAPPPTPTSSCRPR